MGFCQWPKLSSKITSEQSWLSDDTGRGTNHSTRTATEESPTDKRMEVSYEESQVQVPVYVSRNNRTQLLHC